MLGKMLREARARMRISQAQLAERIGVTKGAISQWETGIGYPTRANAKALAAELGISPLELEARLSSGLNLLDALPGGREVPLMRWDQLKKLQSPGAKGRSKAKRGDEATSLRGDAMLSVDPDIPVDAIAAAVADDSMEPKYAVGDCIIFSKSVEPRQYEPYDDVVAIVDDDMVLLRRYVPRGKNRMGQDVFDLISTSPDFETITATSKRDIKLLGTVVEHRKKRRP
jgi:transcriptional regulator with XRE-family HTH domain